MKSKTSEKPSLHAIRGGNGTAVTSPVTLKPPKSNHRIPDGEIAARAYELYLAHGCCDGHDMEDWFIAEQQLRKERGLH